MNRESIVVIETDEDGCIVASVPTLPGCHTQAKSQDIMMKCIKDAIEFCFLKHIAILIILTAVGCGFIPEKVKFDDPRLETMLDAAGSFDRETYGFSPLPSEGDLRLESRSRCNYDAMLHIDAKTSRTIAFRKTPTGYRWIHEQESFQGPKQYTSVDGTLYEQIVLTFDVERVAAAVTNQLSVSYWGEDPRLANRRELQLDDVQPILREWGY